MRQLPLVLLPLCLAALPGRADTIKLVTDPWCPFACQPDSERPGYMIELARAVFEPLGHKVDYEVQPFARAEQSVASGAASGFVGVLRLPKRASWYFPAEPQGEARVCFYTKAGSSWSYAGAASLAGQRIGTVNAYNYGDEVEAALKQSGTRLDPVAGEDALRLNLDKLRAERVTALVEYEPVLDWTLRLPGSSRPRQAGCAARADTLYIAFSPKDPKSADYAKQLSDGVATMRHDGRLRTLLARYGLKDWR